MINSYAQQGRTLTRMEIGELVGDAEQALDYIVGSKLIVLDTETVIRPVLTRLPRRNASTRSISTV